MNILKLFSEKPKSCIWLIAILSLIIIGFIDYFTGYEIGIDLLYLLPIILLSWHIDMEAGILMSIASVFTIIATYYLAGNPVLYSFINLWNILIHLGFFIVIAYLTSALQSDIVKRKRIEEALHERVKELNCIYSIADLIEKTDSIEKIFQGAAELMGLGWYYPGITCVRITFDGQEYKTKNFKETAWKMYADIIVRRKLTGLIEVYYLNEMPEKDEGPFLKEERALINAIAERLQKVAERKQYEKEREIVIADLHKALSEVKTLSGLLPICASCKKIRNDEGYWEQIEWYIQQHSDAAFSHGICPDCKKKLYPELFKNK
jgi:hypothetical protein